MAFWPALLSRPAQTPLAQRPSLTLFFLLVGAFFLTFVPHIEQLPPWLSVSVTLALIVRSVLEFYRLPLPSNAFCNVLAICLLAGIILQFNTMFGREAGTAFMAGLLAVKFFELRGPRDIAVIIFSSFFVVMSTLLYSQALELFIYCLIMMWVLTALLLRIQIGDLPEDRLLRMLQRSGFIFLQALPLTVFLFIFFPRFSGKLQMSLNESPLGLSDTVSPGSIAQLAKDNREAFYVKFISVTGDVPAVETMYWRAMALWNYEDGAWIRGTMAESPAEPPSPGPHTNEIVQQIYIKPHFQKWIFALEYAISKAYNSTETPGNDWSVVLDGDVLQLSARAGTVDHTERYQVTSAPQLAPQILGANEADFGTRLPDDQAKDRIDPEVRQLADRLRRENPEDIGYIYAVRRYFKQNNFVYSASPGATPPGKDWLHAFLFETKTGFCEHYASAFAVLMRLEGIPVRLVVGYQGAQFNPYDNEYIVKQSNAHAWDEVWIDTKKNQPKAHREGHWQRVDPTSSLAPGVGPQDAGSNPPGGGQNEDDLSIQVANHRLTLLSGASLPGWIRRTMTELELRHQQIEANWDDWVFSYDPDTQNWLARAMGFGRNSRVLLGLVCLAALAVCALIFRGWMKQKPPVSPVEKLYTQFCRNMAQRGVPRAVWEGPLSYTDRAAEAFPEKKVAIQDVGRIVARFRYGPSGVTSTPKELDSLLASIASPSTSQFPKSYDATENPTGS